MIKCDENKIFASLYNLVILIDIPNFQIQLYIEFKNKILSLCLLYNNIYFLLNSLSNGKTRRENYFKI